MSEKIKKPELLAPAGNLEKLKTAFAFGADAVYAGITQFGLRKHSENLRLEELKQAVDYASNKGNKIYLAFNSFAFNSDIDQIQDLWDHLNNIKPHALIISDIGIFQLAKKYTDIPIHVSTQANVLNQYGCEFWKKAGAKRIILAREVSLKECRKIKNSLDIELEIFVHGAMCAGYSGKCIISNYLSERDANRGGCVQNCRHQFRIDEKAATHLMNTKDLMAVSLLPKVINSGVDAVKIEGRMKSNLYLANAVSVYRNALDKAYQSLINKKPYTFKEYEKELKKVSNRTFFLGGLIPSKIKKAINTDFQGYTKKVEYIGFVKKVIKNKYILLEVKNPFNQNDRLEVLGSAGKQIPFHVQSIKDMNGSILKKARPNSLVLIPWVSFARKYDVLFCRF
ncbi:U32 family peptidase [Candidatus Margulisiibacteriota bacterium]